jgi:xylan 1,4-beta-xylosidase
VATEPAEEYALAVQAGSRVRALAWHHRDPWWESSVAEVDAGFVGMVPRAELATVMRLDAAHANTFRTWEALGSPEEATPEQIARLCEAGRLQVEDVALERTGHGLRVRLEIPLHGLALLELAANG